MVSKDTKEAQDWANQNIFGGKDVVRYGNNLEFANCANEALQNVYKQYPAVFEKVRVFGIGKENLERFHKDIVFNNILPQLKKNNPDKSEAELIIYAYKALDNVPYKHNPTKKGYWHNKKTENIGIAKIITETFIGGTTAGDSSSVVFNPYFKSNDDFKNLDNSRNIHLHLRAVPPEKWTIYHEIGHLISNYVASHGNISAMHAFRNESIANHSDEITRYGKSDKVNEFFSEAFADYMCFGDKARDVSKEAVKLMEKLYGESSK